MDFDFDGEEDSVFDFSLSGKSGKSTMKRKKRAFGSTRTNTSTASSSSSNSIATSNPSRSQSSSLGSEVASSMDTNSSFSSSSIRYGTTKSKVASISVKKSGRHSRRRIRRRQEEEYSSNDDNDEDNESLSARSHSSASTDRSDSISSLRSNVKSELSVRRGAGSSAYAFQDAGTYQMVHDECTYLCSTILSNTTPPSKAIGAAIELATLLSSRKTRSMLWQGGGRGEDDDNYSEKEPSSSRNKNSWQDNPQSPLEKSKKVSPIPNVWSSILEVLALAATTAMGAPFDNTCSSSNSSISSSTTSVGSVQAPTPGQPRTKYRTKSARRKEKALLQTGGSQTTGTGSKYSSVSKGNKLNADMKDLLACILYFISWDCTMSGEHSIAAIGAVRSSAVARRMRLAILERGAVLSGVMRLVVPSQPLLAAPAPSFSRKSPFPFNIFPTTSSNKLPDPPVSPLRAPTNSISRQSLRSASSLSSSQHDVQQHTAKSILSSTIRTKSISTKIAGDPTAAGRRKRKNRRKVNTDSLLQQAEDSECMPPPSNRNVPPRKLGGSDELSFADSFDKNKLAPNSSRGLKSNDDGSSILSDSVFVSPLKQKIDDLRAKVHIESSSKSRSPNIFQVSFGCGGINIEEDRPWLSIVCLESLCRILTGKELDGKTSCLEGDETKNDDKEDDDSDNENENVVMVTNRLVGKSGMIPLLSFAMSQSMAVATKVVFGSSYLKDLDEKKELHDEEYWVYCHNRLKLLASIIDEACFFSERNRRSFCEDDPFSFQERKKGLIFHILKFLQHCSNCDLDQLDQKRSETMTLALRTLTSLTHDNPLAAEQMKNHVECDFNRNLDTDDSIQGIQVLANLVFQLEESPSLNPTKPKKAGRNTITKVSDHDMHRYDGTIFCFTTLANITEGAGIGRILMEIELVLNSGETSSWLKWLCQWLVKQTETFRHEILSIGNTKNGKRGSITTPADDSENGEIHQDEEEKLVAAGNGCVVLACLISESDVDDSESSLDVRNLIKKQMPLNVDGSSSGLSLIVNTLKAYCNYYHMSMGQMSFAVVSPVKKLIDELEEIAKVDEDQLSHANDK